MTLRIFIISISLITILLVSIYHIDRISRSRNDVDKLEHLSRPIEKLINDYNQLYLISNTSSPGNYFKTQFAFAPIMIHFEPYDNIPKDSLILFVNDLKNFKTDTEFEELICDTSFLISERNNAFEIKLIKKKE